ncbi:leucine-rich repeat-containing protein 34 isoform X4 [Ambystoma mexicanum]|uniref:leucine-rich repeat-containing protein 34 isoform X4 n=1 Tax=Ambystoma mexicanum TaxID=8296 RepID=UPI0037E730D9
MVRGAQRGAPVYSRDPRKVMSSTSNHEIVDVCPTQIQPISHYMTEMVQVDQESALKAKSSTSNQSIVDVCPTQNQQISRSMTEMVQAVQESALKTMPSISNHSIVDVCPTQNEQISHSMTETVQVARETALKAMPSRVKMDYLGICAAQNQKKHLLRAKMLQLAQESIPKVMTSPLKLRYLDVCAELNQPVNPFIAEMLQVDLEYVPSSSIIKIAGNNRLMPVKRVTDNDTMVLAKVLANNTFVKGLDLRFNTLTDTGAEHIGKLLQVTPALSHLNLMGNDIGAEGAEFIARALHHTQSLIALATVLIQNRTIKSLNVNRPILYSLQEEVTIHFSGMLEVNYCLQELHLSKHEMSDVAVERLCEGLERNFTLRFLDLSCNRITCDGVKCLATLLKQNTALEILDLSSNRMEDDGAMHLGDALSMYNNNLKALAVVSNNITGKGLVPLSNAIKTNSTLSYVYIWGNKLDEASCVAFADLLNTGRLTPECTDVEPYVVDGRVYLAELFHGLRKHYYWTPSYGVVDHPISNSSLPIRADYQSFSQD